MATLSLRDVHYSYPDGGGAALDGVTLEVEPGQLVLLLGASGCGKSTLLRAALGLVPHFHGGRLSGRVVTAGLDTREHRPGAIAHRAGLVFQDPEAQLVMRRGDHEVAFGLQNLGCPPAEIAPRVARTLESVAAAHLASRDTGRLSGGEQQRIAIASVLAMGQRLLLLDEPTSQLDPQAAERLLALVTQINRRHGVTVVMAEHRTGRVFAQADRVLVMDAGRLTFDGTPGEAARHLAGSAPWLLPPVTQAFAAAGSSDLPLTACDARTLAPATPRRDVPDGMPGAPAVAIENVHKRFAEIRALCGVSAGFGAGEITALLGANGAGKTTLAQIACGLLKPDSGQVRGAGVRGYVCQNPAHHALRETVADEVAYALENLGVPAGQRTTRVRAELERFGLEQMAGRHPRDLSGGERQRLAVASVTVMRPSLLLLDEPTRGLDGLRKLELAELLRRLAGDGAAVGVITNDADFAGEVATRVTTMDGGRVLADQASRHLLAGGGPFTCQLGLALGCASLDDAVSLLTAAREPSHV